MKRITAEQIKLVINETLDGVEKSNVGGVFLKDGNGKVMHDQFGSPVCSQLGASVFMTTLNVVLLKSLDGGIHV